MKKPKKINFFAIGKKVISNEIDALQEVSAGISKNEFNNVCNFLLETKGNLIFLGIHYPYISISFEYDWDCYRKQSKASIYPQLQYFFV